jgi:site-specific DNA-methyltransferase (adenine-specific)
MDAIKHDKALDIATGNSQKPDEVRDRIVELMGDLPRVELFARSAAGRTWPR